MLYPHTSDPELTDELFQHPKSEYRGAPFWAWNCDLNREELLWQIEQLKAMGFGGFHMHVRSGLSTPYLSPEFMDLISACVQKAKDEHMLAWLYDEDRWPSGAAGGIVTKDHAFRARTLLFTSRRKEKGKPLAAYAISLDENSCLREYRLLKDGETLWSGEMFRYAYLIIAGNDSWFNNQAYLDTLNPQAVKRFLDVTHEAYAQRFQAEFGRTIPAIFTDEPQFSKKKMLTFPRDESDVILPWTDNLEETFAKAYGHSLVSSLPEVIWELPDGKVSPVRYHYHDHLAERFTEAFADQVGAWCQAHNIMLTGHMMEEPTLCSQTNMLGEAMRSYRSFQLPGIDMLCDRREYTTAKQAQSAAHQAGSEGTLSELYGVTHWDFDFRGHKNQGDWQAALGVTVRVPHLAWVSMEGEAKRDYPAAISYQSPWYREYSYVEDHFARLNTALTRGCPLVRVGVIHPIESYWLHMGPESQTGEFRQELDERFQSLTEWLLYGLIDFDFISESLLPQQCSQGSAPLKVAHMAYDVVIVPGCETLRSTTLTLLRAFREAGGRLIFLGAIPHLVDARLDESVRELATSSLCLPYARLDLLEALRAYREIDVRDSCGMRAYGLLHQLRQDGENRWLFLCNGEKPRRPDLPDESDYTLSIRRAWQPTIYDTQTGAIRPCPCTHENGQTLIRLHWHGQDSLLLKLTPCKETQAQTCRQVAKPVVWKEIRQFPGSIPVTLSEPNALLLDQAEFAVDGGPWQPKEEILRMEKKLRSKLGLPSRDGNLAQPWVVKEDPSQNHELACRFTVQSDIHLEAVHLALERRDDTEIVWNGETVVVPADGWYTDKSIQTVLLPSLRKGANTLFLRLPLTSRKGVEWCYLLGDFGVRIAGSAGVITSPVRYLAFGDWVPQGLPFYGGNATYHLTAETEGNFALQCCHFRNPLLAVDVDGERAGIIAYSPYRLAVSCAPGTHRIDLTAFGNRVNTFGAVHHADETEISFGPSGWRTEGADWSNEYCLRRCGVLSSPVLQEEG
jgi:hypothetical protein